MICKRCNTDSDEWTVAYKADMNGTAKVDDTGAILDYVFLEEASNWGLILSCSKCGAEHRDER